jgi:hypothetical protein
MPSPQNAWCFTLNSYTDADINCLIQIFQKKDTSGQNKFCGVFGKEIGDAGNKHLQGLIYGKKKTYKFLWSQINLALGHDRCHWEKKKYKLFSAWAYCVKGEQTHEEWELQGVKGPNWHTNWDGHDTTELKSQIPKLLGERINVPEKPIEELEAQLKEMADKSKTLDEDSDEYWELATEREAMAGRILARLWVL